MIGLSRLAQQLGQPVSEYDRAEAVPLPVDRYPRYRAQKKIV